MIDEREDGGYAADSEREGQDSRNGERTGSQQPPFGLMKDSNHRSHRRLSGWMLRQE